MKCVLQPWHFPPSPQDTLFPAHIPTHFRPSSCASDLASADHCACLQIIFTYLLTKHRSNRQTVFTTVFITNCRQNLNCVRRTLICVFQRWLNQVQRTYSLQVQRKQCNCRGLIMMDAATTTDSPPLQPHITKAFNQTAEDRKLSWPEI